MTQIAAIVVVFCRFAPTWLWLIVTVVLWCRRTWLISPSRWKLHLRCFFLILWIRHLRQRAESDPAYVLEHAAAVDRAIEKLRADWSRQLMVDRFRSRP
jgi:hypothetical protein